MKQYRRNAPAPADFAQAPLRYLKLTPLVTGLLVAFPVASQQSDLPLPDLGIPKNSAAQTSLRPNANGLGIDSNDADSRLSVNTEASQRVGGSIGVRGALTLTDAAALGGGLQLGSDSSEVFLNLGFALNPTQRLVLTGGQLRQKLEFAFPSGATRAEMTQSSGGAAWRLNLGSGLLDYAEATAYTARTASRDLGAVDYAVDTATLYELWRDPRRIAGSTLDGLQGKLGLRPWEGGRASVGFGQERLRYDLLHGDERHTRATGSLGLEQAIGGDKCIKFGVDAAAAQSRTTLGFDWRIGDPGTLGVDLVNIRGRDGGLNDNRVQLTWSLPLGKRAGGAAPAGALAGMPAIRAAEAVSRNPERAGSQESPRPAAGSGGLLDQVATRPAWMPSQVVAKLDTTAGPTRVIAIGKTTLPAGSSVGASGVITTPLGVAVTSIAGVTKNGAAFSNTGQFALSGNSLVTDPNLMIQPAVGVTDIYIVTVNNSGGGTTLVTINVSHGSVKIDSIVVSAGAPAPAAPTASNVNITGTAQVGQTLTGHYAYADINGDAEGTSTFRWLRNGAAISGATASTYTLVNADYNATITFEVTPVATAAPTTGTAVASAATAAETLPTSYISQGGLIWSPNNATVPGYGTDWTTASTYCSTATLLGQTGWRLPSAAELSSLYSSGALAGHGWAVGLAWSSNLYSAGFHMVVDLGTGFNTVGDDTSTHRVTCVR